MRRMIACLSLLAAILPGAAQAQGPGPQSPVGDFYRGRPVHILIGTEAGTFFDLYARLVARHMGKYLPGEPTFVPQNMAGAGGLTAYNHLYNVAARDGSVFGISHRAVPMMPLLGFEGPKFDARKFSYIGSANIEEDVCFARSDAGIASLEDVRRRELMVGTTGRGAELTTYYTAIRKALGAQLKVITGYSSTNDLYLAVERGEIQGRCGGSYSNLVADRPALLAEKKVIVFLQIGLRGNALLPQVPTMIDLLGERDRDALRPILASYGMGRPFVGPPDIPPERLAALRTAFDAAMKDPQLLADAKKQSLDIAPLTGAEMERIIAAAYAAPEPVIARAKELVGTQ